MKKAICPDADVAEVNAFTNGFFDPPVDDGPEEDPPDVFDHFLEKAALAGKLGTISGWQHVENFHAETAGLDTRIRKLSHDRPNPWLTAALAKADDLDAELTDDSHRLEKSGSRRRRSLMAWVRGEVALGKTVRELADFARKHDAETAALLLSIGAELGVE